MVGTYRALMRARFLSFSKRLAERSALGLAAGLFLVDFGCRRPEHFGEKK